MTKLFSPEASQALFIEIASDQPQHSKIKSYLSKGGDINYQSDKDGYTALMLAVDKDDESLVNYLLEEGANPLIQNHHHEIASKLALTHSTIYQLLKNYELLFAVQNNDIAIVKDTLTSGANINFQRKDGYTAILIAVEKNLLALVELLLLKGADISLKTNRFEDVFDLVTEDSTWEILRRERPLTINNEKIPPYSELNSREQAHPKAIEAREDKTFSVNHLKIYPMGKHFLPAPSEEQLSDLEKHFKHSMPTSLKEIFIHYNRGRPTLNHFDVDNDDSISFFYHLDENTNNAGNIWHAINSYSHYLGEETLPFAKDTSGGIYYLKWENNRPEVWLFLYGGDLVFEDDDDDNYADDADDLLPTACHLASNSLDEFLEKLHERE